MEYLSHSIASQLFRDLWTILRLNWERFESSDEDGVEHILTIEELKRPMTLLFWLWASATAIFIIEIIISKCRQLFETLMI